MQNNDNVLSGYVKSLCVDIKEQYHITPNHFNNYNVKRGLRNADGSGVLAGITRIGSVQGYVMVDGFPQPIPGKLYYRGIDVEDIVEAHAQSGTFGYEEVAYLLLLGKLPTPQQLHFFDTVLSSARTLPQGFTEDMIIKAPSKDVMNKLARSVLALYSYDPNPDDTSLENIVRQSIELIGRLPVIVADAYSVKRRFFDGDSLYLHYPQEDLSVSENFLHMLRRDNSFTAEEALLLDLMLVLHAEHGGGNNSTFTCRVLSSSGTDTYSTISAAIGSLKGPRHGGANAKVMEMFYNIRGNVRDLKDDEEIAAYLRKIINGEANDRTGLVYGMGHAVYTISDPRAVLLKKYALSLAEKKGYLEDFRLMDAVERLTPGIFAELKGNGKRICANIDMYSGLVYKMLGIPEELYTPLFAIARIAGWCAHRIEEIVTGGRIIRPAYRSVSSLSPYIPIEQR
ncbi:MAG: citrate/2-methylcitrate synthase [Eubacteriales bacterium]|jgi:citrate synthase